jgi:hypothetical protein
MRRLALLLTVLLSAGAASAQKPPPGVACDSAVRFSSSLERTRPLSAQRKATVERLKRATRNLISAHAKLVAVSEEVKPPLVVCLANEVNALVMDRTKPVFVMTGLLLRYGQEEDMLAAVLAHELGHLVRDHAGYRAKALGAFVYQAQTAANAEFYRTGDYTKAVSAGIARMGVEDFAFRREQEADADSFAAVLLTRAGYKAESITRMMSKMLLEQGDKPAQWFSTHPGWAERLDRVEPRVADEELDQLARALANGGDSAALARRINAWLAQLPDSGNAWFHKAAFLERLRSPHYVEAYERALTSHGPALSRTNAELSDLWLSLCAGLYRSGHKLESAHCSRYIAHQDMYERYRAATFGNRLFVHGPAPAGGSLLAARDQDGSKLITNDARLLRERGLSGQAFSPWRATHFPSPELSSPLPER